MHRNIQQSMTSINNMNINQQTHEVMIRTNLLYQSTTVFPIISTSKKVVFDKREDADDS